MGGAAGGQRMFATFAGLAWDGHRREYSLAGHLRLLIVLASHADRPLAEVLEALRAAALAHGPQMDDQTALLIRRVAD